MRRIRYSVATSLDGYIAGPNGESDWIVMDPEIDFVALFSQFDTILMGRHTYEVAAASRQWFFDNGMRVFVFSRSLDQRDHLRVTIVGENQQETLMELKQAPGKDIWLTGGASLFRSLAAAGLVDAIEVTILPVLLGGGIPLLPPPSERLELTLTSHRVYKSGIVSLTYAIG